MTQDKPPQRLLLSGNKAIARAALDAGVALGAGYPGTPSTEILENFALLGVLSAYRDIPESSWIESLHANLYTATKVIAHVISENDQFREVFGRNMRKNLCRRV